MLGKHHYFNKESYLKKCHADAFCPQEMDTFCRCGLLCSLAVSGLRPRNDSRACGRRELEETPALAGLWLGCHDTGALSPPLQLCVGFSSCPTECGDCIIEHHALLRDSVNDAMESGSMLLNLLVCPHPCPSLWDSAPRLP